MAYRVGVVGASGRTGRFVVEAVAEHAHTTLAAAFVSPQSKHRGEVVAGSHTRYSADLEQLSQCDGVIDFSRPEISLAVAQLCAERELPLLIGTTGFSDEQRATLEGVADRIPLCIASNTSIGATVLGIAAEYIQRLLGGGYDCEVMEIHHRFKRDAPSGTALSIINGLTAENPTVVFGRTEQRQSGEIGVVSLRGGDTPGDHTVYFLGDGDRIEVRHNVHNRKVFGTGAVVLLERLFGRSPGLYSVRDLLGVQDQK